MHYKHYFHSSKLCDSNKAKTLPACITGYLMALNIPWSDMSDKKYLYICFVFLVLKASAFNGPHITWLLCIMWDLMFPWQWLWRRMFSVICNHAVWYSCTDLPKCMSPNPTRVTFINLLCRHLKEHLVCWIIPLQGVHMTTQKQKRWRHTARPHVDSNPQFQCLSSTRQCNFKQYGHCKQLF